MFERKKNNTTIIVICLHARKRVVNTHWSERICNKELWKHTGQERMQEQIRRRTWNWFGHTLKRINDTIANQAVQWTLQGCRGG